MTAIYRLTENFKINPTDSFPLWDSINKRTRRITGATLLSYIEQKNIKSSHIDVNGHLIFVLNDDSEIDAGILPPSKMSFSGEGVPPTQVNNLNFSDDFTLTVSSEDGSVSLKANPRTGTVNVEGNITGNILAGSNMSAVYNSDTQETTLNVDGSNVDPAKGFTLDTGAAIKTQIQNGDSVDVILADDLKDLFIGNRQQCMQLKTACNGIYVQYDEGEGRILLDDEGAPGIKLKNITDTAYCSFDYQGWSTIITDNSAGDICYFVQAFKGALFSGLPDSITLDPDTDYLIASEVTQRKGSTGFAHRLSIVSTAEGEDDANNRTIQRAGSNFEHAKQRWSEVMLKRDAIVFEDMTVGNPQTFDSIIAGANMYGVVNDGALILNSNVSPDVHTFDTLTTRVLNIHEGPDNPDKFIQVYVDGNKNTTIHAIGDTHYYAKDKDSGDLSEVYQIDSAHRFIVKTKIKVPVITNPSNGTTNSATDGASYFDLSSSNTVKVGAYSEVKASVNGVTVLSAKSDHVALDGNLTLTADKKIDFASIGNGEVRNLGLISRNDSNDNNSVTLGDGENTYKSNKHTFRDNQNNTEIVNFTTDGQNLKNNNLKYVRHVVGNTPGSMYVANVAKIKRDDANNDKDVIDFATDSITAKSKKIEFKDDTNSRRLTIESHKADWHGCQLNNLAEGVEDTDAATVGQLNGIGGGGIPWVRKFDSNGGQIFAHTYPEGRVQAWINYKGNGSNEVSIDSMRPIPEGQTGQMYDMVALDNQSQNVCKLRLFYENNSTLIRIMPGEIVQCWTSREFARWKWIFGTEQSPTGSFASQEEFTAKSGYSSVTSGGGSTHRIEYWENGSILSISNSKVEVRLLEGMSDENKHGYVKYINTRNSDVEFEWYDRNGNIMSNSSIPNVCPANTVVEIFADYNKDQYFLNFGQSKVINTISEEDQLMEGLASGFIYAKTVTVG